MRHPRHNNKLKSESFKLLLDFYLLLQNAGWMDVVQVHLHKSMIMQFHPTIIQIDNWEAFWAGSSIHCPLLDHKSLSSVVIASGKASIGQPDSWQQVPPPQPVQQPLQTPAAPPQPSPHPSTFVPNAPPPAPPQQNPSSIPYFSQLPQSQMPTVPSPAGEPYLGPPVQPTYTTHQLYQMRVQQSQPPSPQQYQSESQLQQPFSQPIQTDQPPNPSPQLQPTLSHPTEESAPYMSPSQSYPPSICQPAPLTQPSTRSPPTQRFYGPNTSMYEPPASRPSLVPIPYCAAYNIPTGASFSEPYSYSGSPSHYGSCTMKPSPFSSSAASGGSNYQHLPMAEVLPQALPTESSSGGSTGNGVAIDDVVEKLASMGFSRYQVRATVQKLTENGQSVDLNIVLDKLMNDGDIQPQKG